MRKILILTVFIFSLTVNFFAQEDAAAKKPFDPEKDLIGLENQQAPLFTKLAMDGEEFSLEKLKGKIVLINLWGTFCPPCLEEIPKLNELVKKYSDKGVVFLAPTPDKKSVLDSFLQKTKFDYQVLPDSFDVIKQYAPKKKDAPVGKGFMMLLPTHLVIDQNGLVTKHSWGFGEDTSKVLDDEIERLLKNPPSK